MHRKIIRKIRKSPSGSFYVDFADDIINNEGRNMENQEQKKCRVTAMLTADERESLRILAESAQRSMSAYIRYLVICQLYFDSKR
jgi:hypothetical protein